LNLDAIVKSGFASLTQSTNQWALIDTSMCNIDPVNLFNIAYWQKNNAITGTAQGRGTTYFIQQGNQEWVLRHYYRGGLIGRLVSDSYLYLGLAQTRAIKEYLLLAQLQQWKLPAPAPIACNVSKHGLHYKADIITARIAQARDLYTLLKAESLSEEMWHKIGRTIGRFHQNQVYHHDLNIHNILIDHNNDVWLIDFDQGAIKTGKHWQQANMNRLLRSFHKEKNKNPNMHWIELDWQPLLDGYQSSRRN